MIARLFGKTDCLNAATAAVGYTLPYLLVNLVKVSISFRIGGGVVGAGGGVVGAGGGGGGGCWGGFGTVEPAKAPGVSNPPRSSWKSSQAIVKKHRRWFCLPAF